jgi:hypothetical protein
MESASRWCAARCMAGNQRARAKMFCRNSQGERTCSYVSPWCSGVHLAGIFSCPNISYCEALQAYWPPQSLRHISGASGLSASFSCTRCNASLAMNQLVH